MKRDLLLALLLGFVVGALSAIIAVRLPSLWEKSKSQQPSQDLVEKAKTSITPIPSSTLEIEEPKDESVSDKDTIKLTGKSIEDSALLVETNLASDIVKVSKEGTFSSQIKLTEGGNPIFVTRLSEDGNDESIALTVFYTSEKL